MSAGEDVGGALEADVPSGDRGSAGGAGQGGKHCEGGEHRHPPRTEGRHSQGEGRLG